MIRKFFVILRGGIKLFLANGCLNRAAAMSFYAFFSLIPILLLTTVALSYFLGSQEGLMERVLDMTRKSLPYLGPRIISDLKNLAREWSTLGWISVALLMMSAELVMNAASDALQAIFEVPGKYGFLRKRVVNSFMLLILIMAALLSVIITAATRVLALFEVTVMGFDITAYVQSLIITNLLPFFLMVMAVSVVFWVVSGDGLSYEYSFYGSVLFTTVWETAKQLFAWYISVVPTYNKFYGSLGTIMILLLWLFFSFTILLFSASVAKAAYKGKKEGAMI